MDYRFTCDGWGASFDLPYSIVGKYLSTCSAGQLKVILAVFAGERATSSGELARLTGLSESEVGTAVEFWLSTGVIGTEGKEQSDRVTQSPEPEKVVPVSAVESIRPVSTSRSYFYDPVQIKEKSQNDENVRKLMSEIESLFGSTLNAHECSDLLELYEYYKFDVPSILMSAQYCAAMDKRTVRYLRSVMKKWYENGICSCAEIEQELIRRRDVSRYQSMVLKIFGIENRPSPRQVEIIESWRTMGISKELITIAYNKCMDALNKPQFGYINKILTSWAQGGITSAGQVEESDRKFRESSKEQSGQGSSYDLEEIERFAENYTIKSDQ